VISEGRRRARVDAWLDKHQPQILRALRIIGTTYSVWVIVSSDGRIVPWRAAIVLCIVALLAAAEVKNYLRRRARGRREQETSGS
jgi:hypothetical protein